ncbi:MAG: 3-hydroxyacyl-CoA dehydrogenase family protein [Nitrososphaerales archaeon]
MSSNIKKIGVVGAGVMGAQIAEVMAFNGYEVKTRHRTEESKQRALSDIKKTLNDLLEYNKTRAEREIKKAEQTLGIQFTEEQKAIIKDKLKPQLDESTINQIYQRIHPTLNLEDFNDVDLIIESVVEEIDVKKEIFKKLDEVAPSHTILASNTSTIMISEIAAATKRPDKVIGIHFFNPPTLLPLIEVIPGLETSQTTVDTVINFCKSIKNHRATMQPIVVKDIPGFLVNRVLMAMLNEAFALYEEGVADMKDIDLAMKSGAGMPMGPFELADLIGIDVLYHMDQSIKSMQGGNTMPKPIHILRKMVAAGRLGRKTKRGFYEYK